ncbi:hypothetical protein Tco_1502169 [Tanacetum coccineum]
MNALMATKLRFANLLKWFPEKQFPPTNNQLRTSSNSRTSSTCMMSPVTEPFKEGSSLLMEAKEKGYVLDAEAEAFSLIGMHMTQLMKPQWLLSLSWPKLSSTSCNQQSMSMKVHSNDNQIFDNVDYQLSQEMHQEEHLDSDAETKIDHNTIPYHQYLLDTEAQNVPTEVSADTSDKVSMIAILTDLQTQLDGHAKVNQEKCLEIETVKQ